MDYPWVHKHVYYMYSHVYTRRSRVSSNSLVSTTLYIHVHVHRYVFLCELPEIYGAITQLISGSNPGTGKLSLWAENPSN